MRSNSKRVFLTAGIAALLALPAILTAQSGPPRFDFWPRSVRWPASEYQAPPIYAQISYRAGIGWEIYHDSEWAAIPFYRDPACVPPDFNLLDAFDAPRAFDCPVTVQGFEIFEKPFPPNNVQPPIKAVYWGLGDVPIYFVKWPKLQEAVADYRLTMDELKALLKSGDAVVGSARYYWVELHPSGGTVEPFIEISAYGLFQDHRQFRFYVTGGDQTALIKEIRFDFK